MAERKFTEDALAKLSKVNQKTINNILNMKHAPKMENVEKLASVFGLLPWQILIPGTADHLEELKSIEQLTSNFLKSDVVGRVALLHIAEREAIYKTR